MLFHISVRDASTESLNAKMFASGLFDVSEIASSKTLSVVTGMSNTICAAMCLNEGHEYCHGFQRDPDSEACTLVTMTGAATGDDGGNELVYVMKNIAAAMPSGVTTTKDPTATTATTEIPTATTADPFLPGGTVHIIAYFLLHETHYSTFFNLCTTGGSRMVYALSNCLYCNHYSSHINHSWDNPLVWLKGNTP